MATSRQLSESPATQQQYLAQLALTAALIEAIRNLWPSANPLKSPEKFRQVLYFLTEQFGQASASIATDYYRAIRVENGITDALTIRPAPMPTPALVDQIIARATNAEQEARDRLAALMPEIERDLEAQAAELEATIQQRIEASMQKAIADVARQQGRIATEGDKFALGYRRIARPDACAWCITMALRVSSRTRQQMTGDRGRKTFIHDPDAEHLGVYKSRETAGAASHFDCNCVVEPVFFHGTEEAGWLADMRDLYDTYDVEEYGPGIPGFRRALAAYRRGEDPTAPAPPQIVTPPASQAAIDALLDLLPQVA